MQTSGTIQNHLHSFLENKSESQSSLGFFWQAKGGYIGVGDHAEVIEITGQQHQDMLKTLALLMNHFKLDWKVMWAVMLTMGAVISGSAALSVLHVGEFVPQDLDVYVTLKNMVMVLVYLEEQGYSVQIPLHNSMINSYMKSTIILTRKNDTGDKIDLVATTKPHIT